MAKNLVTEISYELDDLEKIEDISEMQFIIDSIRSYLNEIESEIDDINRSLNRLG